MYKIKTMLLNVATEINVETPYLTTEVKRILIIVGGFLGSLLGGYDGLIRAFIVIMSLDYITGVMVAYFVKKNMSSQIGAKGLAKKCYMLIMIIVGHTVDVYVLGVGSMCRTAVIMYYIGNEALSITENAGNLGVPIPQKLIDVLIQIKEDNKNGDNEEIDTEPN